MGARHKLDNKSADMSAVHLPQIKGRIQRGGGEGARVLLRLLWETAPLRLLKRRKKGDIKRRKGIIDERKGEKRGKKRKLSPS